MSLPPTFPLWCRVLALLLLSTGVLLVCAAAVAEMLGRPLTIPVGIIGGLVCGVFGCLFVVQRIVCGRYGWSILNVEWPRNCSIWCCRRSGTALFPEGDAVPKKRKWPLRVYGVLVLLLYVSSYAALSRQGYAEADQNNMKGFYYFSPEDTNAWRWKNYGCMCLFRPINAVDRWLGFGRHPGCEPLWGLRK